MRFITLTIQSNGMPLYIQANAITAICQATSSHVANGVTEVHTPTEIFFVHESVDDILEKINHSYYPREGYYNMGKDMQSCVT